MKHELQEIVAVVNNKGGVGKTATVQSLASGIVRLNHNLRVLVIDLDPQCNLSSLFGVRDNEYDNIYNAMCKQSGVPVYKCKMGYMQFQDPLRWKYRTTPSRRPFTERTDEELHGITGMLARQRLP